MQSATHKEDLREMPRPRKEQIRLRLPTIRAVVLHRNSSGQDSLMMFHILTEKDISRLKSNKSRGGGDVPRLIIIIRIEIEAQCSNSYWLVASLPSLMGFPLNSSIRGCTHATTKAQRFLESQSDLETRQHNQAGQYNVGK